MFLKDFSDCLIFHIPPFLKSVFFSFNVLLDSSLVLTIRYTRVCVKHLWNGGKVVIIVLFNKRDSYLLLWYDTREMRTLTVVLCIVLQVAVWL